MEGNPLPVIIIEGNIKGRKLCCVWQGGKENWVQRLRTADRAVVDSFD